MNIPCIMCLLCSHLTNYMAKRWVTLFLTSTAMLLGDLLDVIFNEVDATEEGCGAVLKALWSEASDRAAFYQDQAKNSETLMIIIPLGFL